MPRPDGLLPRFFCRLRDLWALPVRQPQRARLQVEALEAKVLPSTVLPLAKLNGLYKVSFTGKVPVDGGYHLLKASYGFQLKNGVITDVGAGVHGGGRLTVRGGIDANASFRGLFMHLHGQGVLNHGKLVAKGSWNGIFQGHAGSGTWVATKVM